MTDREAMKMALEALENADFIVDMADAHYGIEPEDRLQLIEALRQALAQPEQVSGDTSDGYHTFNELYDFRKAYNAALFNEWAASGKYSVHKSKRHYDGEYCFGGGWFIVVAKLPDGLISNHYEMKDWDKFQLPETEKSLFEYDNHTGEDVLNRLFAFRPVAQPEQEPVAWITRRTGDGGVVLSGYETCEPTDYDSIPVYTAPPRKPWVGLTDEEIKDIWINTWKITEATDAFAYAIEAKLKEKNT